MPSKKELRSRWIGEEPRVKAIIADLRAGENWTHHLVAEPGGFGSALPYVMGCDRPLLTGEIAPRDLRGLVIRNIDVIGSPVFSDTALDYSILDNVHLEGSSLTGASFRYAVLCGTTSLKGVIAQLALFVDADCRGVSFNGADLTNANLSGADFRNADLRDTRLAHVKIDYEGALGRLTKRRWTRFGGPYQTLDQLHPNTRMRIRKHIAISSEIMDFHHQHPVLAWFWYLLANYGRSAGRLGCFALLSWFFFAAVYSLWPAPPFGVLGACPRSLTLPEAMYLSAVTITTLGYGDIVPAAVGLGRLLVGLEAVSGVVIIGALIALLIQNATLSAE
jgi:hypothetical protein